MFTYCKKDINLFNALFASRLSRSKTLVDFLFQDYGVLTVKSMDALLEWREDEVFYFLTTSWSLDIVDSISARVYRAPKCVDLDPKHRKRA